MAIAFGLAATANDGNTGTLTMTNPGVSNDDYMVVGVRRATGTAITGPGGWTNILDQGSGNDLLSVWGKKAASEGGSWDWTGPLLMAGGFASYTGVATATAVDTSLGTSSLTLTQISTANANEMVIGVFSENGVLSGSGDTFGPPSGMTERVDYNVGISASRVCITIADVVQAGTGNTGNKTFTWSGTDFNPRGVLLALIPAATNMVVAPSAVALVTARSTPVLATADQPTAIALAATGASPTLAMAEAAAPKALATSLSAPVLTTAEQPTAIALAVALATPVLALALTVTPAALAIGAATPDVTRVVYGQGPSGSASIGRVGPGGSASVTARGPGGTTVTTKGPGGSARISL